MTAHHSCRPGIIVFDFDGTLVDSNQVKYHAFFALFRDDPAISATVESVLGDMREASRYEILREILKRAGVNAELLENRTGDLADRYARLVEDGVSEANECPYASEALATLKHGYSLYISSMTPQEQLVRLVGARGWTQHVKGIYGYPRSKPDTLREIRTKEGAGVEAMLVVGDGGSDRDAAAEVGCRFFHIDGRFALADLMTELGVD